MCRRGYCGETRAVESKRHQRCAVFECPSSRTRSYPCVASSARPILSAYVLNRLAWDSRKFFTSPAHSSASQPRVNRSPENISKYDLFRASTIWHLSMIGRAAFHIGLEPVDHAHNLLIVHPEKPQETNLHE